MERMGVVIRRFRRRHLESLESCPTDVFVEPIVRHFTYGARAEQGAEPSAPAERHLRRVLAAGNLAQPTRGVAMKAELGACTRAHRARQNRRKAFTPKPYEFPVAATFWDEYVTEHYKKIKRSAKVNGK